MENPYSKWDDLGGKPTIYGNTLFGLLLVCIGVVGFSWKGWGRNGVKQVLCFFFLPFFFDVGQKMDGRIF